MKLTGKKALITRGNSGIGLATARLFIAEGAQVAITGRDQKTLDGAVAELGPNARGYRADITVAEDRKQLFATLAKDFGKLDIKLKAKEERTWQVRHMESKPTTPPARRKST
jgi:NAD(P)-dependent dehydrogenase (short-subunit alcohol dehydrogenase family)